jgi:hypothetical protein
MFLHTAVLSAPLVLLPSETSMQQNKSYKTYLYFARHGNFVSILKATCWKLKTYLH